MLDYLRTLIKAASGVTKAAFLLCLFFLATSGIFFYLVNDLGWDNPKAVVKSALMGSSFGLGLTCLMSTFQCLRVDLQIYRDELIDKAITRKK